MAFRVVHPVHLCRNRLSLLSLLYFVLGQLIHFSLFVFAAFRSLHSFWSVFVFPLKLVLHLRSFLSDPIYHIRHHIVWLVNKEVESQFLHYTRNVAFQVLSHFFQFPLILHLLKKLLFLIFELKLKLQFFSEVLVRESELGDLSYVYIRELNVYLEVIVYIVYSSSITEILSELKIVYGHWFISIYYIFFC